MTTDIILGLLWRSFWETIWMTGASGLLSLVIGLPLGLALVVTSRDGIAEQLTVNRILAALVNGFRAVPFVILLIALIPLTRLIVGTALGTTAPSCRSPSPPSPITRASPRYRCAKSIAA